MSVGAISPDELSARLAHLRRGGWRYQAVYEDDPVGRQYSFCEVYFDKNDRLHAWTETAGAVPCGEDLEQLTKDLVRMYVDACRWAAVAFSDLRVGMTFTRLIAPQDAEMLAVFFDQIPRPQ